VVDASRINAQKDRFYGRLELNRLTVVFFDRSSDRYGI